MNIEWKVIPHSEQRYDSSGDWYWSEDGETLFIRISRLSNAHYEFCLGLHELVEAVLCRFSGISQQAVDDFDIPYEEFHKQGRKEYPCGCPRHQFSDPGNDRHSPYYRQHRVADVVERLIAAVLRINFDDYDAEVDRPPQ